MVIVEDKDKTGPYFQYANRKRYYYTENDQKSRMEAYRKALKQKNAIHMSKYSKYLF